MAAITTAAIGVATSVYSIADGISQKNSAKKALDNLNVPTLDNPNRDIQVSTEGSDLIREEGQRNTANILDGLRGGSARNMLSALPRLTAMNNEINQKAALDIDKQMTNRQYAIAGYETSRNQIDENRYQNEIAGIGNMYNQANQQMWNGVDAGISGAGALGRAIDLDSGKKKDLNGRIDTSASFTTDYGKSYNSTING